VAAAMVVSRVGKEQDLGRQIMDQMFVSPRVLGITASVMGILGIIPGMPHLVFLAIASILGYAAWVLAHKPPAPAAQENQAPASSDGEASWDDLQPVDQLGLELGYRLITLVDKNRQGDLLTRIKGVRRKFAQEVGFLPPPVHVRDNLELNPVVTASICAASSSAKVKPFPACTWPSTRRITTPLIGTATIDPAFGLPAHWIDERQKEVAQMAGFTVVDSETVMATHLSHLMQVHAPNC